MKFRVIDSLREFESFQKDYDRIFYDCSDVTPYQSFGWTYNYAKYFLGQNKLNICVDGQSILPMWRKNYNGINALEFIGTRGTDYLNFITNNKELTADTLLYYFTQDDTLDIIYLEDIIETDRIIDILESKSSALGLYFKKVENCPICFINLPRTSEVYLASLSKRMVSDFYYDIRYAEKHLRAKLEYCIEQEEYALLKHIELHQKGRIHKNTKGSYYKQEICDFMMNFIKSIPMQNRRISFLQVNGQPITSTLSVIHQNKVFLITVGFDPEYSKYNPGKILFIKDILDCIESGYEHYDLSRGAEEYKTKLGAIQKNNMCIYISKKDSIDEFIKSYNLIKQGVGYNPDL